MPAQQSHSPARTWAPCWVAMTWCPAHMHCPCWGLGAALSRELLCSQHTAGWGSPAWSCPGPADCPLLSGCLSLTCTAPQALLTPVPVWRPCWHPAQPCPVLHPSPVLSPSPSLRARQAQAPPHCPCIGTLPLHRADAPPCTFCHGPSAPQEAQASGVLMPWLCLSFPISALVQLKVHSSNASCSAARQPLP